MVVIPRTPLFLQKLRGTWESIRDACFVRLPRPSTTLGARNDDGSKVHLLSAFVHHEGITIAQKQIPPKNNEITAARSLLEPLDLKGKVVTADAMHTQKDLARFLVEDKHADYCLTVKDNQQTLKEDIVALSLSENFFP